MFFEPLILAWGLRQLAADLGLPVKNVRRWLDADSIPAEWFAPIARLEKRVNGTLVTTGHLSHLAEQRRIARSSASLASRPAA